MTDPFTLHPLLLRGTSMAGTTLGDADQGISVRAANLSVSARFQHVYIVGQTGTGKSTLLLNMVVQDIAAGHGVTVLDPHGSLVDDVLARISAARAKDVVLVDPSDVSQYVGLNPLDVVESDPTRYVAMRDRVIDELLDIFDALYDLRLTGGPIFEQTFRTYMTLVMGGRRPTD